MHIGVIIFDLCCGNTLNQRRTLPCLFYFLIVFSGNNLMQATARDRIMVMLDSSLFVRGSTAKRTIPQLNQASIRPPQKN